MAVDTTASPTSTTLIALRLALVALGPRWFKA